MTTVVEFQTRFPEFAAVAAPRIQLFLDDAALNMKSPEKWLSFYDVAQAYYAAHLLTVGEASATGDFGALAPISHQEVDDVVIKNAVSAVKPTTEDLYSTTYGKRYVTYRRKCMPLIIGV